MATLLNIHLIESGYWIHYCGRRQSSGNSLTPKQNLHGNSFDMALLDVQSGISRMVNLTSLTGLELAELQQQLHWNTRVGMMHSLNMITALQHGRQRTWKPVVTSLILPDLCMMGLKDADRRTQGSPKVHVFQTLQVPWTWKLGLSPSAIKMNVRIVCHALSQVMIHGFTITTPSISDSLWSGTIRCHHEKSSKDRLLLVKSWHLCFETKRACYLWTLWKRVHWLTQNLMKLKHWIKRAHPNWNMTEVLLHEKFLASNKHAHTWGNHSHGMDYSSPSWLVWYLQSLWPATGLNGEELKDDNNIVNDACDCFNTVIKAFYRIGIQHLVQSSLKWIAINGDFVKK